MKRTGAASIAVLALSSRPSEAQHPAACSCKKQGHPACVYVKSISVVFDRREWPNANESKTFATSGGRYVGTLTVTRRNCQTNAETTTAFTVKSGGNLDNATNTGTQVNADDDTPCPAGDFNVPAKPNSNGRYNVNDNEGPINPNSGQNTSGADDLGNRDFIRIHGPPGVSTGCIVFTTIGDMTSFSALMAANVGCACAPNPVPLTTSYNTNGLTDDCADDIPLPNGNRGNGVDGGLPVDP